MLTVTDEQNEFAGQVRNELSSLGFRVEADTRNEKLGFKVREAQLEKIPYMLVIGDKEKESGTVNVRKRSGENLGAMPITSVAAMMDEDCQEPFKRGGMRYSFGLTK